MRRSRLSALAKAAKPGLNESAIEKLGLDKSFSSMAVLRWLYGLFLLLLIILSAHVRYKWRGEKREWQGPFYEDEWPDEEPAPASLSRILRQLVLLLVVIVLGLVLFS